MAEVYTAEQYKEHQTIVSMDIEETLITARQKEHVTNIVLLASIMFYN